MPSAVEIIESTNVNEPFDGLWLVRSYFQSCKCENFEIAKNHCRNEIIHAIKRGDVKIRITGQSFFTTVFTRVPKYCEPINPENFFGQIQIPE